MDIERIYKELPRAIASGDEKFIKTSISILRRYTTESKTQTSRLLASGILSAYLSELINDLKDIVYDGEDMGITSRFSEYQSSSYLQDRYLLDIFMELIIEELVRNTVTTMLRAIKEVLDISDDEEFIRDPNLQVEARQTTQEVINKIIDLFYPHTTEFEALLRLEHSNKTEEGLIKFLRLRLEYYGLEDSEVRKHLEIYYPQDGPKLLEAVSRVNSRFYIFYDTLLEDLNHELINMGSTTFFVKNNDHTVSFGDPEVNELGSLLKIRKEYDNVVLIWVDSEDST